MTTIILHIEASTETCSVALSQDGHVFFERANRDERSHAKVLAPFVEEALKNADEQGAKINAVAAEIVAIARVATIESIKRNKEKAVHSTSFFVIFAR